MQFSKPVTLLFAVLFCIQCANAQIIYVDANAVGDDTGTNWTHAYNELSDALVAASSGDEIWVAQGAYAPDPGTSPDRNSGFEIPVGVQIYGGFDGTETARNQRDFTTNLTILTGDNNDDDGSNYSNRIDNAYSVISFLNANNNTIVDGFTIADGHANGTGTNDGPTRSGGAIFNTYDIMNGNAEPTIANCIFKNNYSLVYGGAIYNNGSGTGQANCTISNCTFENNVTGNSGGAIYNSGSYGGEANPVITQCTFDKNFAMIAGGSVYNDAISSGESSPDFINCIFSFNKTDTINVSYAGAVYNFGKDFGVSSPTFMNCLFYRNQAFAGGTIYSLADNGNSSPEITNCTFYKNRAFQNGGAVYINGGNSPGAGVGVITINNSIFWDNIAQSVFQGDIFRFNYGTINLNNCLVDAADCNAMINGSGPTLNCNAGNIYDQFPEFIDTMANNFNLTTTSPAVNTGLNAAAGGMSTDLSNNTRIISATIDMGPFENQLAPLPVELTSFDATLIGESVLISWSTATELNNDYFEVQRSSDGINFYTISAVHGQGTSNQAQHYQHTDHHPLSGQNYYRLKQVDYDGTHDYSAIRVITMVEGKITTYPNPVTDALHIAFNDFTEGAVEYRIFAQQGQLVVNGQADCHNGLTIISLNETRELQPGTYFIRIIDENGLNTESRFVKMAR